MCECEQSSCLHFFVKCECDAFFCASNLRYIFHCGDILVSNRKPFSAAKKNHMEMNDLLEMAGNYNTLNTNTAFSSVFS